MAKLQYRPEIDGLRAIAVLSVLFYHAGFTLFGGGFVGVDVFFVISGYLITSLIVREVGESGSFRFGRFYLRRIRRLFPALLCTVLFTWAAAFIFFSPAQMQDFAASTIAALTSVSNVYFWFEADYFDVAATTKPLLHTWSLSVEEQFYFIWPAVVVFLLVKLRNPAALAVLGTICIASLLLAQYWLAADRDAAFYLLPARVVELGIGAALVWLPSTRALPNSAKEAGAGAGLALIVYSIFAYAHDTPFPGVASLIPCVGTALFIAFSDAKWASAPLRTAPMVWFGKISYSLYLVHWPIVVFYAVITQSQPDTFGRWLIIALSVLLGWVQYRFIETRFRNSVPNMDLRFAGAAGVCAILVSLPSATAWQWGGMEWRVPAERRVAQTEVEMRNAMRDRYCTSPAPSGTFAGDHRDLITCQNYRGKRHDIIVWGDSHALHLAAGVSEAYPNYNVHIAYMNGCVPQSGFAGYVRDYGSTKTQGCVDRNLKLAKLLKSAPPAHILITSAKRYQPERIAYATSQIIKTLNDGNHAVRVVADFIRPGKSLIDCVNVPAFMLTDEAISQRCTGDPEAAASELLYNERFAAALPDLVRVSDLQCAGGDCTFIRNGQLLYRDSHHFNIEGSIHFTRLARNRLAITTKGWGARLAAYEKNNGKYKLGGDPALVQSPANASGIDATGTISGN
ncbi:acyltransferase family protein [Pseudahrensia aquimaris]|uniref:Acyltransferase family protein n=1 Tax=Pseudahrensia aquimaris TaxID=744461 RepID=A0ABW3FGJ7_9HYPH